MSESMLRLGCTCVYPLATLTCHEGRRFPYPRAARLSREQFLDACQIQDKPASQVLREFRRKYVAEHSKDAGSPRRKRGAV